MTDKGASFEVQTELHYVYKGIKEKIKLNSMLPQIENWIFSTCNIH